MVPLMILSIHEAKQQLAEKSKSLRLLKKWKRSTLAKRSGVTESSLRRFEQSGNISLENLLKIMNALGRLDEINSLLKLPIADSIDDLKNNIKIPKRGVL